MSSEAPSSGSPSTPEPWWILPVALLATLITLAVAVSIPLFLDGHEAQDFAAARAQVGGDPIRGLELMKRYGCAACHTIPGLAGSHGAVGPMLRGIASRPTIGHNVKNTPENLVQWIIRPVQIDPKATMPSVGATAKDARDIATYLYALK